jgi:superfamily I DNA/RNA helicase
VNASFKGPSKVFGGAGTGKTVVALHRAKRLAETEKISTSLGIGLLTFSKVLANDLIDKANLLMGDKTEVRQRVFVSHLDYLAHEAVSRYAGKKFELTTEYTIKSILTQLHKQYDLEDQFTPEFIFSEYMNVIGPWGLTNFQNYKNFQRLGRQTPLNAKQREKLSKLYVEFEKVCYEKSLITYFQLYQKAVEAQSSRDPIFDHIILDETQDLGPHMLAFVRSLVSKKPNDIMLCGDTGQSLYTRHHSFRRHGFDVQGRSRKLFVNYRTSRQIKETADKLNEFLLELSDEPNENRRSISIFDGPQPLVKLFNDRDSEIKNLLSWIKGQLSKGVQPHEIVVLTPNDFAMSAASAKMNDNNIRNWKLDATANYLNGEVGLAAIRRVKGLEYRSVAIIGCDEDQFPNANKMNELGDGSDFDEFLTLEKNSLYVAMTRARDNLLVSGITPGSAFLGEFN